MKKNFLLTILTILTFIFLIEDVEASDDYVVFENIYNEANKDGLTESELEETISIFSNSFSSSNSENWLLKKCEYEKIGDIEDTAVLIFRKGAVHSKSSLLYLENFIENSKLYSVPNKSQYNGKTLYTDVFIPEDAPVNSCPQYITFIGDTIGNNGIDSMDMSSNIYNSSSEFPEDAVMFELKGNGTSYIQNNQQYCEIELTKVGESTESTVNINISLDTNGYYKYQRPNNSETFLSKINPENFLDTSAFSFDSFADLVDFNTNGCPKTDYIIYEYGAGFVEDSWFWDIGEKTKMLSFVSDLSTRELVDNQNGTYSDKSGSWWDRDIWIGKVENGTYNLCPQIIEENIDEHNRIINEINEAFYNAFPAEDPQNLSGSSLDGSIENLSELNFETAMNKINDINKILGTDDTPGLIDEYEKVMDIINENCSSDQVTAVNALEEGKLIIEEIKKKTAQISEELEEIKKSGELTDEQKEILDEVENDFETSTDRFFALADYKFSLPGSIVDVTCQTLFTNTLLGQVITEILQMMQILAPIALILMGIIDFSKAALSNEAEELSKATARFVKRAIAAVGVFFVPLIVTLLLNFVAVDLDIDDPLCSLNDSTTTQG